MGWVLYLFGLLISLTSLSFSVLEIYYSDHHILGILLSLGRLDSKHPLLRVTFIHFLPTSKFSTEARKSKKWSRTLD